MKQVKRTGWVRRNISNPESDAEHSFSLAMLVMLFAPNNLDRLKCLQLALIHDLPEIYCGDIIPGELDPVKKQALEKSAMAMVVRELKLPQLQELFEEFEQHETPEAQFVWVLDRLDNVFTARMYEDTRRVQLVQEFADSAFERLYYLNDKDLRAELDKVLAALTKK